MASHRTPARLDELLSRLRDEDLSAAEAQELEAWLLDDPLACQRYVQTLALRASLRWMYAAPEALVATIEESGNVLPAPQTARTRTRRLGWLVAATALTVLLVAGSFWLARWWNVPSTVVATLTDSFDCTWGMAAPINGWPIEQGELLKLTTGIAQIKLASGVVVVLEGPVTLRLVDRDNVFLEHGRLVAHMPSEKVHFQVETRTATVHDLEQECGIGVDPSGDTLVQAFDGTAEANQTDGNAHHRLSAGQALRLSSGRAESLEFAAERFVRQMPEPPMTASGDIAPAGLVPYNRNATAGIDIPFAADKPVIDGDLSDWQQQGGFESVCVAPYGRDYHVAGHMMYDRDCLYIGAHVGDPFPMRNVIDPQVDPSQGWKGGAVQVRLSTDPTLGWPLSGQARWISGDGRRPEDTSHNLVHLTMWYFAPRQAPSLYLEYGMRMDPMVVPRGDYQAAFRQDADGRGYVLEYAIPWSLLNTKARVPQPGDPLGVCWNVHWSDETGRLWKGYLVDVLNPEAVRGLPDDSTRTYARAVTWGRARYLPPAAKK